MKNLVLIGLFLLLISACTSNSSVEQRKVLNEDNANYDELIANKERQIIDLEQQLRNKEEELKGLQVYKNLHEIDYTARRIINQLKAKEYQDIKEEQGVDFEILDENTLYFENPVGLHFDTSSLNSNLINMNVMVGDETSIQVIYYSYVETAPIIIIDFDKVDNVWKFRGIYTGAR